MEPCDLAMMCGQHKCWHGAPDQDPGGQQASLVLYVVLRHFQSW